MIRAGVSTSVVAEALSPALSIAGAFAAFNAGGASVVAITAMPAAPFVMIRAGVSTSVVVEALTQRFLSPARSPRSTSGVRRLSRLP